ncbi:MAG: glycosyltransferase family 9 protein [Chloroherpetonaceae bacterium]
MAIPLLKTLEKKIREATIALLRKVVRRRRVVPSDFDIHRAKLLCLRQNQIGDTLISTPIFAALKSHYPNLTLDVLLDKRNATTLDTNTHIRTRFVLNQKFVDFFKVLAAVRREQYDFIVDLVHTPSSLSTLFCLLGKSRFTVGFERENDFIYDLKVPFKTDRRMLRTLAEVLTAFGINPDEVDLRPQFPLSPSSCEFAQKVFSSLVGEKVVGINISASLRLKFWGVENFVLLIRALKQAFPNAVFLVLYAKAYRVEAEQIAKEADAYLCDETKTLTDFAAVISKLHLLITPDSAAVHLADAFNVPCVILTHNPEHITAWYPSFSESRTIHSKTGEVRSIGVAEVYQVAQTFVREQLLI